ncbi:DUF4159 domain-containing protein [Bacteroides sp. 214]|uniref:DUF4159 domain-containing protein n=1 Tax=Bacteroides sp. 214 TaxID=2302935 RepID=UPI0013CFA041|nr:DUF4159 domain-containing protein [Bacteroides sp. 214]
MSSKIMDATLVTSAPTDITNRINTFTLVQALAIIFAGVVMLISANKIDENAFILKAVLEIAGLLIILLGAVRFMSKPMIKVYLPTGSAAQELSLFFDLRHADELKKCINSGIFPTNGMSGNDENGNLRMDIILSKDGQFAAVQLFQFIPYAYKPITELQRFTSEEAEKLNSFLQFIR